MARALGTELEETTEPGRGVRDARSPGPRRPRGRREPGLVTAGGRGVRGALRALGLCYLGLESHLRGDGVRRAAVVARRAQRARGPRPSHFALGPAPLTRPPAAQSLSPPLGGAGRGGGGPIQRGWFPLRLRGDGLAVFVCLESQMNKFFKTEAYAVLEL